MEHRSQRARMPCHRHVTRRVIRRAPIACAAALLSATSGAELVIADVRLGVHALPTDFQYTVHDDGHSASGSTSFQSGYGLDARAVYAFAHPGSAGGFFVGADVFGGWYNYDSNGTYRSLTLRALGGYAYAINEDVTLEVTPFIGVGAASFHVPGDGLYSDVSVKGSEREYGAMLGASWSFARHWLLVGEAGYMATDAKLTGDGLAIDMKQAGPAFFLGLVYRFNAAPPRVE